MEISSFKWFCLEDDICNITNILDMSTKPASSYSPSSLNSISLASLYNIQLAYLTVLCILQLTHTARISWRINNKTNNSNNCAREMDYDSFDVGEDDEHSGVSFMDKPRLFPARDAFCS